MKRFECEVVRTDKYIIEIDESKLNEEWMEAFRSVFYDFNSFEEHAEHIAQLQARFGNRFIEGYGDVKRNGQVSFGGKEENRSEYEDAINIKVISEDYDCYVDVEEIFGVDGDGK